MLDGMVEVYKGFLYKNIEKGCFYVRVLRNKIYAYCLFLVIAGVAKARQFFCFIAFATAFQTHQRFYN